MLGYTVTVCLLLAKRLGGVVLVGDDDSDQKSVLDLWWNPGCNEVSGCKNWMRGVWTEAANQHFSQQGSSLAEASLGGQWVHDDSETPTTTKHGWIASKITYEDHVLLLEHDSEEEDPECFPNGLVKMPHSTLNGKSIHPGSVLLVEQCVQADGGSVEHFGTVTRVHHDGTHVHASTESLTRDDVQLHVNGGSASFLLPLADEMIAEDASTAAKKMLDGNQFLERGTLQRVVKSGRALKAPDPKPKKADTQSVPGFDLVSKWQQQNLPDVGLFEAVQNTAEDLAATGTNAADVTKILADYKEGMDKARTALAPFSADCDKGTPPYNKIFVGSCLLWKNSCPENSHCGWGNCWCNVGTHCKAKGGDTCIPLVASAGVVSGSLDIFKTGKDFTGSFTKEAAATFSPGGDGKGVRAGFVGTLSGAYKATARIGATFSASVTWADFAVTKFSASVTGTASLTISANLTLKAEVFFHAYLMNYVELNLGDFVGLPMLRLSIMPVIALDVEASATGEAKFDASWNGKLTIGNDATDKTDDDKPVEVTAGTAATSHFTLSAAGTVNAALKLSIVCTAGVDVKVAKAIASVSATVAAEFEGKWPKVADKCPQFQLTSRADGSATASLFWWAWTRQFTLKELKPIKVCGKDYKQECVWYIGDGCPASPGNALSAVNSSEQLDDYYHNL